MFERNNSLKHLKYFILLIGIFFLLVIYIFYSNYNKRYESIYKDEIYKIQNENFLVKDIYIVEDNFYLELVRKNYLDDIKLSFIAQTKKEENKIIKNILDFKYKGLYVLKIPVPKNYNTILLTTTLNDEKFYIYFNESEIKSLQKKHTKNEIKISYLELLKILNLKEIEEIKKEITKKNKEILKVLEEKETFLKENELATNEEKQKIKQKESEFNSKKITLESEKNELENKIITLKNKNIIIENEVIFLKTNKKIDIKNITFLKMKNEKGEEIKDKNVINDYKKEEQIVKKDEEKESKSNVKNEEIKIQKNENKNHKKVNLKPKVTKNESVKVRKKTTSKPKKVYKKTPHKKENSNIKIKKIDKEKNTIDFEFTP